MVAPLMAEIKSNQLTVARHFTKNPPWVGSLTIWCDSAVITYKA
jgi:hypothetical protein